MTSLRQVVEIELLPWVEKPMRYIGGELNCVRKDLSAVAVHGVLCFPDAYDIGMSHYGSQVLYHVVNKCDRWALSRCYHPWLDAERVMREKHIPLFALEYFTPVRDADFLGFTVQYELQYTNLVNMLDLAGLPVMQKDRNQAHPLVIAGGPCMGNPEPIADFVDVCAVGDGEQCIADICDVIEKAKARHAPRKTVLESLAKLDGLYVPSMHPSHNKGVFAVPDFAENETVNAARIGELDDVWCPDKPLVPLMDVVHHRLTVEILRGCTRGCRFCAAGMTYRPVRERTVDSIRGQIERGAHATGWTEIGLLSLSTADYSDFNALLDAAQDIRDASHAEISLPSTRIDALSEEQIQRLRGASSMTSFTIAPEAGSQRLRNVINKDFTDGQIAATARLLLAHNVQTLKLYFMLGLPTETDEDIEAIAACVSHIADIAWETSKRREVHVSLSPYTPKPHTPFQWEAMDSIQELDRKSGMVRRLLKGKRNVKIAARNPEMSLLETVMARGDRSTGALICRAWRKGARFDGWTDCFSMQRWREAAAEVNVDMALYAGSIAEDQPLPWSSIFTGPGPRFLLEERNRARLAQVTPDCRHGDCCGCAACRLTARKLASVTAKPPAVPVLPADAGAQAPAAQKARQKYVWRFEYVKGREVRFLSHLDMVAVIHRAMHAAGIALSYSEGFRPHPRVAFGPPLPLGVMGERELFDAVLAKADSPSLDAINRLLPDGLKVAGARRMEQKGESLNAGIIAGRYVFALFETVEPSEMDQAVERVLAAERLEVALERKGAATPRDIRPLIYKIEFKRCDGGPCIEAVLSMRPSQTCRPAELLLGMFPQKRFYDFLVRRTECLQGSAGALAPIM